MQTVREREKLVARVRRIRGQIEAVERAITEERGCYDVLQTVTAARGALSGPPERAKRPRASESDANGWAFEPKKAAALVEAAAIQQIAPANGARARDLDSSGSGIEATARVSRRNIPASDRNIPGTDRKIPGSDQRTRASDRKIPASEAIAPAMEAAVRGSEENAPASGEDASARDEDARASVEDTTASKENA